MLSLLLVLAACTPDPQGETASTPEDTDTGGATDTGGDTAECEPVTEACNGVDDDCDGEVDEAGSLGETVFYADADDDGFGDPALEQCACAAPDGYVGNPQDCDDSNAAVNPGGSEVAGDGADNDCDPSTVVSADLYDAFSATANPNGQWSFGYALDATGASFTLFGSYAEYDASLDYWHTEGIEGARFFGNHTAGEWVYSTARFDAMALTLHPGASGEYAVVRWRAAAATTCAVDVTFSGNDSTTSTVAVRPARRPPTPQGDLLERHPQHAVGEVGPARTE